VVRQGRVSPLVIGHHNKDIGFLSHKISFMDLVVNELKRAWVSIGSLKTFSY
jgi:hypothetical protein